MSQCYQKYAGNPLSDISHYHSGLEIDRPERTGVRRSGGPLTETFGSRQSDAHDQKESARAQAQRPCARTRSAPRHPVRGASGQLTFGCSTRIVLFELSFSIGRKERLSRCQCSPFEMEDYRFRKVRHVHNIIRPSKKVIVVANVRSLRINPVSTRGLRRVQHCETKR